MARNRKSYNATHCNTWGTPGSTQDHAGTIPGSTQGCNETLPKTFTPADVEYSILRALAPAMDARGASAYTFDAWTLPGHGIAIVLANGQEFRCEITVASDHQDRRRENHNG